MIKDMEMMHPKAVVSFDCQGVSVYHPGCELLQAGLSARPFFLSEE